MKARLSGCSGKLLPIAHAKIAETGELIVGCEAIHIGQLRDGKLIPPDLDENGMFHTGDIVRFDEKQRLHIEGRIKDVIIGASGENIYPDEIENAFTGIPGVYVPLDETLRGFQSILSGDMDAYPEAAFYNVGTIDEAVEKAKGAQQ